MRLIRLPIAICLVGVCLTACGNANASPIRTSAKVRARQAQVHAYWDQYYTNALKQHRIRIKGLNALKVLRVNADGTLPQSPMVAYLKWRRSLNPARFAKYHPKLAQMIVRDIVIRGLPKPNDPGNNPKPGGVNPPPPPPQVPEPNTFLIATLCIGAAAWWRTRSIKTSRL